MLHKFFMLLLPLFMHPKNTHPLFFTNHRSTPDIYLAWGQLCQWLSLYSSIRLAVSRSSWIFALCFFISKCTFALVESYYYFWLFLLPVSFGNLIFSLRVTDSPFSSTAGGYIIFQYNEGLFFPQMSDGKVLIASSPRWSSAWILVKKFQGYKHHLLKSIKTNKNTLMNSK